MPTSLTSNTFLSDSVIYIRDTLTSGLTDPLSSRPGTSKFVMTNYPTRDTVYPMITVKENGISVPTQMGFRSTNMLAIIPIEIRIWAKSQTQKDKLTQQIIDFLRTNQYTGQSGTTASNDFGFFDFKVTGMIDVDDIGTDAIKSKVIFIAFTAIL